MPLCTFRYREPGKHESPGDSGSESSVSEDGYASSSDNDPRYNSDSGSQSEGMFDSHARGLTFHGNWLLSNDEEDCESPGCESPGCQGAGAI